MTPNEHDLRPSRNVDDSSLARASSDSAPKKHNLPMKSSAVATTVKRSSFFEKVLGQKSTLQHKAALLGQAMVRRHRAISPLEVRTKKLTVYPGPQRHRKD
jgi:hypothetical protein